jgi:hypothetical protein
MEREYFSEAGQSKKLEDQAQSDPASFPRLSGRMKHLLIGVRLSVVMEAVQPANDLEALAYRIDRLRAGRVRKTRNSGQPR